MNIAGLNDGLINNSFNQIKTNKEDEKFNEFKEILDKANPKNEAEDEKLQEVCKEFEQYFVKEMYKAMKKTVNYDNFMGYSQAEEIFSDMLDDEYIKGMSSGNGIGLAKMMYEQIKGTSMPSKIDGKA